MERILSASATFWAGVNGATIQFRLGPEAVDDLVIEIANGYRSHLTLRCYQK